MAIYYVDLENGNDSTGTGTNLAPFKTQAIADQICQNGDEIRLAKNTTADTTVSQSFVWTSGSKTVTVTGVDVTATLPVGSYIGKPTASGNGARETFYRVSAITFSTNTTITLQWKYYGTTETTASAIKKFIQTDTGNDRAQSRAVDWYYSNVAGADRLRTNITVSGGWNLATETRDGETWFKANPANWATVWTVYGCAVGTPTQIYRYLNVVESYQVFTQHNPQATVIEYCTFMTYIGFDNHPNTMGTNVNTITLFSQASRCMLEYIVAGTKNYKNIFLNTNASECMYIGVVGSLNNFTNCLFVGTTGISTNNANIKYTFDNCEFNNLTNGILINQNNIFIDGKDTTTFNYCTYGIYQAASTYYSNRIKSVITNYCTYGIYIGRGWGLLVENHVADNCAYCLWGGDDYARSVEVRGFTYTNIGTWGIYVTAINSPIYLASGSADNVAKLIYNPAPNSQMPKYYANDVAGIDDGIYWATKRWKKYNTVYRTNAPSFWFSTDSTESLAFYPTKMFSYYAIKDRQYKISFYMKVGGPSWVGTIEPTLRLNGVIINEFATKSVVSSDWELVEYSMTAPATVSGELTVNFVVNQNINDLYVDDFSVTDIT